MSNPEGPNTVERLTLSTSSTGVPSPTPYRARLSRSMRMWRAAALALALALALGVLGLTTGTLGARPSTATTLTAASAADTRQLAALQAEVRACRDLGRTMRMVVARQESQWAKHRSAHKLFMAGKISQDRRNAIWRETIIAGDQLAPLVHDAAEQWRKECAK